MKRFNRPMGQGNPVAPHGGLGRLCRLAAVLWLAATLSCAAVIAVAAETDTFATDTPEQTVATLHDGLVALAAAHRDADVDRRHQALRPLIAATHDLAFIAEFTIRRQWAELTADERTRFLAAFERLSLMTYATHFAEVGDETFAPLAHMQARAGRAEVRSAIRRRDADDIPLEYVLEQRDDGWRIINIVADGVSDLALKRAEYQRVIGSGGLDALIRHIETQTAGLVN